MNRPILALVLLGVASSCVDQRNAAEDRKIAVSTAALGNCTEFTSSLAAHETAGRAYRVQEACSGGGAGSGAQQRFVDAFPDLSKWTESGEGDWNVEPLHASSGYTGGGAPAAHVDDCDAECTIALTTGINLTGMSSAQLTFLRFVDSEFDSTDYLRVQLYNGSTWSQVFSWSGGSGDTNTWQRETVNLSAYLGVSNFKVRFVAKASLSDEHAQIDDVEIVSTPSAPTCPAWYATGTNTRLGTNAAATATLHSSTAGSWSVGPCGPQCGDGTVNPPETCDGNCPTSCADSNTCTTDTLTGAPSTCNVQCAHTLVTSCRNADGCCASGCNAANDNDCRVACGNGVVESGERCDGDCPTGCNDQNACTVDVLAGSPLACDARCVHAPQIVCRNGDGCCPAGCTKSTDNDCTGAACPSFTGTVTSHKSAGRAYSQVVFFVTRYYATGSNDSLGTSGSATVTLYQNATGVYSLTLGAQCGGCSCTGKACGADNGCGVECSGPCTGSNQCIDTSGMGNFECLPAMTLIGDPNDPLAATAATIQYLTVAIQQLIALQAELAQVPNTQQAIGELQRQQADLQGELDTVNAKGNLQ